MLPQFPQGNTICHRLGLFCGTLLSVQAPLLSGFLILWSLRSEQCLAWAFLNLPELGWQRTLEGRCLALVAVALPEVPLWHLPSYLLGPQFCSVQWINSSYSCDGSLWIWGEGYNT